MTPLQTFCIERKAKLLEMEKRAPRGAQQAILGQLQAFDSLLIFLASQQTEDDMTKLRLTLDKQAISIDDIGPASSQLEELSEAIIELTGELEKQLQAATKKDPNVRAMAYELNNLPPDAKPKTISMKVYQLRHNNRLPLNVLPTIRTVTDKETGEKVEKIYLKYYREAPKAREYHKKQEA